MSGRRSKTLLIAFTALTVVTGGGVYGWVDAGRRALDEELRLAKAAGMITTAAELKALVPEVDPGKNAAPIYALLAERKSEEYANGREYLQAACAGTVDRKKVDLVLLDGQFITGIINDAQRRPECRFDRKWELGFGVLFPEYAGMRGASRLVALQGWKAAWDGRPKDALKEIAKINRMADDVAKEPVDISFWVSLAIREVAWEQLAHWAYYYPEHPEYLRALREQLAEPVPFDRVRYAGAHPYFWMSALDSLATEEGWKEYGLEGTPPWTDTSPMFAGFRFRGRADLIKASRLRFQAMAEGASKVSEQWEAAAKIEQKGAVAALGGTDVLFKLMSGGGADPMAVANRKLFQYRVISMALALREDGKWPEIVPTLGFTDPATGKPIQSKILGKQIEVGVQDTTTGADGETIAIKIPSDPPMAAGKK